MRDVYRRLTDADLRFLAATTAGPSDVAGLVRAVRDDPEILAGMMRDDRVVDRLLTDPEAPVRVSPRLLFTVFLERVLRDMQNQMYTFETDGRYQTALLDGPQVVEFASDQDVSDYLVEVLVSFVRVSTQTVVARVRKGVWRRYRTSDLDLWSLVRHANMMDEAMRFPTYKRIGDLCLFLLGVFPESVAEEARRERRSPDAGAYAEHGIRFYRLASEHVASRGTPVGAVLANLADNFVLATKPLKNMAGQYLGGLRQGLFADQ